MTQVLASVNGVKETLAIINTAVDIIDLKQSEQGALGALPLPVVKQIVQLVNKRKRLSATVGDLPMHPEKIFNAVSAMTETGVDYIKIGFFPGGDWQGSLSRLAEISHQKQLIAVIFADAQPDFSMIKAFIRAGFSGVMLDTMNKSNGSLTQVLTLSEIKRFVAMSKEAHLLCGLAGSLKAEDIPKLLNLKADYLGFRGALCEQHNRMARLDIQSVEAILYCFKQKTAIF